MNVTIAPTHVLSGEITAPPSKAHTHRTLFAGLLSADLTRIMNPLTCDDTEATAGAIVALGAEVDFQQGLWSVQGTGHPRTPSHEIQCRESGVTLRFTLPIASLTGSKVTLKGKASLMRRPIGPLADAMNQLGVKLLMDEYGVHINGGKPKGRDVRIRGDVSSQFISGLLLAGPLMENGLEMELTSPLESRNYVSLTLETMRKHGIQVESNAEMSRFGTAPGQEYKATTHRIPGDYSSAAFPLSAAAITESRILVRGLQRVNSEPDEVFVEILSQMGVETSFSGDDVLVRGRRLKAAKINIRDCPDLGPILAVLGCYAEGKTQITGAARLRYKESDRLAAVSSELRALGADIIETDDGLIITGPSSLTGGIVHSHGDHRIAMALSVAALGARGKVVISGAECVSKSYPTFFHDLRSLGVDLVER